ncbi:MAG: alpha/beta hydrolase [Desulfobacterales bacterium]|nr:alpha/beta hydrolase [Desulfobacterales bacterium]
MPSLMVNGVELYYQLRGQGPLLLFIHGLGSSGRDWQPQVDYFSRRYRTMTVDLRGHGRSGKPPGPCPVALLAADVSALLAALDIRRVHLVGISLGGMVGFQLAADQPELVASLVVVNTMAECVLRRPGQWFQYLRRLAVIRFLGMRRLGVFLGKRLFPKPEQQELRRTFVERWADNDPGAYRAVLKGMIGWSVVDRLPAIRCPVLVVAAEDDYTPLAAKQAYLARLCRGELALLADLGHAAPAEDPARFNIVLERFLASHAR